MILPTLLNKCHQLQNHGTIALITLTAIFAQYYKNPIINITNYIIFTVNVYSHITNKWCHQAALFYILHVVIKGQSEILIGYQDITKQLVEYCKKDFIEHQTECIFTHYKHCLPFQTY